MNFEPFTLLFEGSCLLCSLFWPILLCYFATHTTDRVASIGDMVFNSNWTEYPTKLQKYTILTIARSQKLIFFTGMGLVNCSLEVFAKVSIPSTWFQLRNISHHFYCSHFSVCSSAELQPLITLCFERSIDAIEYKNLCGCIGPQHQQN